MNIIRGILRILFGLFILAIAYTALSQYFGGSKSDFEKFSKLLNEGERTAALLDDTYTELTIKGNTSYITKYTFKVDDKEYQGKHTFDYLSEFSSPLSEVIYLKTNPEINALQVEKQLLKAKEDSESSLNLIIGIGALLLGIILVYSGYIKVRTPEVKRDPKAPIFLKRENEKI